MADKPPPNPHKNEGMGLLRVIGDDPVRWAVIAIGLIAVLLLALSI